jgi:hypothetical protein
MAAAAAAELPPVTVTYRRSGVWHDALCDELGPNGLVISAVDFETARSVIWTGLRRLRPVRGVREVFEGYGTE